VWRKALYFFFFIIKAELGDIEKNKEDQEQVSEDSPELGCSQDSYGSRLLKCENLIPYIIVFSLFDLR